MTARPRKKEIFQILQLLHGLQALHHGGPPNLHDLWHIDILNSAECLQNLFYVVQHASLSA